MKKSFLRRKPFRFCLDECEKSNLPRTLSLIDLIGIGVGGTVGSGIFVLTGFITHSYAGGGVIWSWIIAGIGCLASALSYAELSSIIPSGGSSYSYVFIALGELPAYLSAWCISLEYGISGAAVASSWGDKLQSWIVGMVHKDFDFSFSAFGLKANVLGGGIQLLCVLLMLTGIEFSKKVINGATLFKVVLISFIIVAGLFLYDPDQNPSWTPFGVRGIIRGAASCFFGYVGYDEVCCMAGEAKNPTRDVPLAVLYTVATVTVLYVGASLALVGMENYSQIKDNTGFSSAFESRGWIWAQQVVAIGELLTLPIVVLVSFLAQPQVQFVLAQDGLLPAIFTQVDQRGCLTKSIIITGLLMTVVAVFLPFSFMDELISGGVLISFNLTNTSLIIAKYDSLVLSVTASHRIREKRDHFIYRHMILYHTIALFTASICFSISRYAEHLSSNHATILLCFAIFGALFIIVHVLWLYKNKPSHSLSGEVLQFQNVFEAPGFPILPLLGIFVNYYLLSQLSLQGFSMIGIYFLIAIIIYIFYSIHHRIDFPDEITISESTGGLERGISLSPIDNPMILSGTSNAPGVIYQSIVTEEETMIEEDERDPSSRISAIAVVDQDSTHRLVSFPHRRVGKQGYLSVSGIE